MPPLDVPMALLFILFLALFLAVGILPAWKRTAGRIRRLRRNRPARGPAVPAADPADGAPATTFEFRHQPLPLTDLELFVLVRLARAGRLGRSARQLQGELHFDRSLLSRTLGALHQRGLVQPTLPTLAGSRYALSAAGREFMDEQGELPQIRRD